MAHSYPVRDNVFNISAERLLRTAGDLFVYQGEYDSALEQINQMLAIHPSDVRALGMKGDILYCLNRDMEALEVFNRVLKIQPTSVEALLSKACTLEVLGKPREALTSCHSALALLLGKPHHLLPMIFEEAISLALKLKRYHEAGYLLREAAQRLSQAEWQPLQSAYQQIFLEKKRQFQQKHALKQKTGLRLLT